MNSTVKPSWESTAIVQLRYVPFKPGDGTERGVLDYIAIRLIAIARNERRLRRAGSENYRQNFSESKCLVGIDISGLRDSQVSYLDNLALLIHVYPFILVNSSITPSLLKGSRLHQMLRERYFILPVFEMIPAEDPLWSTSWCGNELLDLIAGRIDQLPCNNVSGWGVHLRPDDYLRRYRNLRLNNETLTFGCPVTWLGVDSPAIADGLSAYFDAGTEEFDIDEFVNRFRCPKELMKEYIDRSMLFSHLGNNKYHFRLSRKNILPSLMNEIARDFEQKLVERESIDTSHSTFVGFPSGFVEYHSIGRLFDARDTYSLSLLSHVRQQIAGIQYTCIAIIDNGKERALCDLIPKVFDGVKVIRIINYYGQPILSPFDTVNHEEKVFLITDLVNSGRFLKASLALLRSITKRPAQGVYAFVAGVDFKSTSLFEEGLVPPEGCFVYFVNKKLSKVSKAKYVEQDSRFSSESPEAFLLFWHTVKNIAYYKRRKHSRDISVRGEGGWRLNAQFLCTSHVELHEGFEKAAGDRCPFCGFLRRQISRHKITAAVILEDLGSDVFGKVLLEIDNSLSICSVDPIGRDFRGLEDLATHKSIGIFCVAVDVGSLIDSVIVEIERIVRGSCEIHVVSLLHRVNAFRKMGSSVDAIVEQGTDCKSISSFYHSNLPCYLMDVETVGREHFHKTVNDILLSE